MEIVERIAQELSVRVQQVQAAVNLLEDATVPFVARYRKEATGGLDDTQLRRLEERLNYLRQLEERREVILNSIRDQDKLTDELEQSIRQAETQVRLEDLYLPYRPKRRTKAQIAREAGLEPLALSLWKNPELSPETEAVQYIAADQGIEDSKQALDGARQILMEVFSEDAELVGELREFLWNKSLWKSSVVKGKEEEGRKFSDYFDYSEPIRLIPSHRILALLRGRREGILRLSLLPDAEHGPGDGAGLSRPELRLAQRSEIEDLGRPADGWLLDTVRWTWKVKVLTRLETDLENQLREQAEEEAIRVFAANLRDLLLAAPAGALVTMGLDPGIRTGVKVCVVDQTGKLLETATIYPHEPRRQWDESIHALAQLAQKHGVSLISIGNGTASRETDKLVRDLMSRHSELNLSKLVVSESGASVYSASEVASNEFPDVDVSLRGAISIARRLQDPLAELVKIEPKAIGVGQYQHDVNQVHLEKSLDSVVEDCVNAVGVDVNTASAALLRRVSGLGPALASSLVAYRNENGSFRNRGQLTAVPGLGPKTFEQAAGFLRILGGDDPLDASAVHPEAYPVVERIVRKTQLPIERLIGNRKCLSVLAPVDFVDGRFGEPTVRDILSELEKPGRDPRPAFETASFKEGVNELEDLAVGMQLEGVVTNVTNFGAFVDIGVHQDGLVHISQLSNRFVKDPREVVKAGEVVKVRVLEVDLQRRRIALSMKSETPPAPKPRPRREERPAAREARQKEDPGGFNRPFTALRDLQKRKN